MKTAILTAAAVGASLHLLSEQCMAGVIEGGLHRQNEPEMQSYTLSWNRTTYSLNYEQSQSTFCSPIDNICTTITTFTPSTSEQSESASSVILAGPGYKVKNITEDNTHLEDAVYYSTIQICNSDGSNCRTSSSEETIAKVRVGSVLSYDILVAVPEAENSAMSVGLVLIGVAVWRSRKGLQPPSSPFKNP